MVKKIVVYGLAVYILGLFFAGITRTLIDFVPYFVAGMIVTTPIYGAVRKHTGKGQRIKVGALQMKKVVGYLLNSGKTSITVVGVIVVALLNVHSELSGVLMDTGVIGAVTFVLTFAIWEVARIVAKKAKKVQFMSFGEALKGAF